MSLNLPIPAPVPVPPFSVPAPAVSQNPPSDAPSGDTATRPTTPITPPSTPSSPDSPPSDSPLAPAPRPPLCGTGKRRKSRALQIVNGPSAPRTGAQRLLILDAWQRSGLPAQDFAALVSVSKHTLYAWKKRFEELGPAGLEEFPRGARRGSRLPELTKRTILMIKKANPDFGCQRISDMLARGPALPASPNAVARALREAGYQLEEVPTHQHAPPVRRFERERASELWQSDLFTFVLKRQNRRVYLVAFLDSCGAPRYVESRPSNPSGQGIARPRLHITQAVS